MLLLKLISLSGHAIMLSPKENLKGVIYAHQLRVTIGECVRDLEVPALVGELGDVIQQVIFLPL
jgi:hypothetical protein